jgi:hypothetical protein
MTVKRLLCALCGAGLTLMSLAAEEHRTAVAIDFVPFAIASSGAADTSIWIGIEGTFEYSFSELFALKGGLCFMNMELSIPHYPEAVDDDYYIDTCSDNYFYPSYLLTKLHLEGRVYPFKTTLRGAFVGAGYAFAFGYTKQSDIDEGSQIYFWHSLYGNLGYKFMFKPASNVSFYIEPALIFSYCFDPGARSTARRDLARAVRLHGESLSLALGVAF